MNTFDFGIDGKPPSGLNSLNVISIGTGAVVVVDINVGVAVVIVGAAVTVDTANDDS